MLSYSGADLPGVYLLTTTPRGDDRGRFGRFFCADEHARMTGAAFVPVQVNHSVTAQRGTVRGLHFQHPPATEGKIVRCLRGAVYDVALDLRAGDTFLQHVAVELTAGSALFIPRGFAHGFQTLTDDCELLYLHDAFYAPAQEDGLRFDDPALGIGWPLPVTVVSARDMGFAPVEKDFKGMTEG